MSIFRDFFVKEKPVFTGITRGVGGFGFGATTLVVGEENQIKLQHLVVLSQTMWMVIQNIEHTFLQTLVLLLFHQQLLMQRLNILSSVVAVVVDILNRAYSAGGGGGAGGLRTNVAGVQNAGGTSLTAADYPVSAGTYTVVVGDGGLQGTTNDTNGTNGGDSAFYPPSHGSYPAVQYIRGAGGGGGGNASSPYPSTVPQKQRTRRKRRWCFWWRN